MRIVSDESIDAAISRQLRRDGHEVVSIAETAAGVEDEVVFAIAVKQRALLLTADKDFGELVFRQGWREEVLVRVEKLLIQVRGLPGLAIVERQPVSFNPADWEY